MGRGRIVCGLFLVLTSVLGAQVPEAASVFLDSSPIGARVVLDGQVRAERTPTLLRGLPSGEHTVTFWKDGYQEVTRSFRVVEGRVQVVLAPLAPESVSLVFPQNEEVATGSTRYPTVRNQFRFPTGTYYLADSEGTARLNPVFPDAALLDTAGWALAVTGVGTGLMAGIDTWVWKNGGPAHPSALTWALGAATLSELAWYLTLETRKREFYREAAPQISPLPQRLELAFSLSREGDAALQAGDLSAAEAIFRRLVQDYPDSTYAPAAWFRLARVHSVTGRQDLALGEYRLVAERFPQASTHDRARQALADLYEVNDRPDLALYHLDRMVLSDGFFDQETLEAQRARLTGAEAGAPIAEASETTPRQAFDRVLALFGQGHPFTVEELAALGPLQERLSERGDANLVADLDLIRVAVRVQQPTAAESQNERAQWEERRAFLKDRQSWVSVRNAGVVLFHGATASLLLGASLYDRGGTTEAFWSMTGAGVAMGLSLFPLLWAEPRQ